MTQWESQGLYFASVHCGPPYIYFLVRSHALRLPLSLPHLILLEKQTDLVTMTLSNMALLIREKQNMKADPVIDEYTKK